MNTYSTRTEAIAREIAEPLGEYASEHDVEAIADDYLGDYSEGYAPKPGVDFWEAVERHAL